MKLACGLLFGALALVAAQAPDLTGTWSLNVQKSTWGHKAKPQSVVVRVEQTDPELKYSGTTVENNGDQNKFDLEAAMDGQQHAVKTSYGPGQIAVKRVNPYTWTSDFHSDDGKFLETATTTISQDGRTMTRRMHTKGPDGEATWIEVYEKQ